MNRFDRKSKNDLKISQRCLFLNFFSTGLVKRQLQRLTQTFLTLSLADVAARCQLPGPGEAEKYLLQMIEAGEISARISHADGMVEFLDEARCDPTALSRQLEICQVQENILASMDDRLALHPEYVKRSSKTSSAAAILHEDEASLFDFS